MALYKLAPQLDHRLALGAELVVFNPASWETHVLNDAAAAVLEAIAAAPKTEHAIAALLRERLIDDQQAEAPHYAHSALEQLRSLGLILATD
jgi:PqqD family protein of HPr-rel-A system